MAHHVSFCTRICLWLLLRLTWAPWHHTVSAHLHLSMATADEFHLCSVTCTEVIGCFRGPFVQRGDGLSKPPKWVWALCTSSSRGEQANEAQCVGPFSVLSVYYCSSTPWNPLANSFIIATGSGHKVIDQVDNGKPTALVEKEKRERAVEILWNLFHFVTLFSTFQSQLLQIDQSVRHMINTSNSMS